LKTLSCSLKLWNMADMDNVSTAADT